MQGILILATFLLLENDTYKSTFLFMVLLNLKHIYIYFLPAFGIYLLMKCLLEKGYHNKLKQISILGLIAISLIYIIW